MPNYGEFGLDNTRFRQDIEDAKRALNGIGKTAEQNAMSMDSAFKKAGQMAAGYFSIAAAAGFVSQLIQIRGEFQKLEVGFTTMLGSKEKSNQLMAQMVDTAMKTPFTLTEVASGAKQLLAYQVAQEDVNKTLIQLGNIASGLGVPMERLIMVYGQVKAKGKLMGDDLRQFTEAGVPMIHELAKQMGVADGEVQKLISSGKVGFPEVQKVIENLTGAGGMFYNLMEAQSKTVTGQLSNVEDAWSKMLNQIGSDNDGVIYGAISGVSSLITNYETVGKVLAGVIAVVGTYKAGLMIMTIQQNRATAAATAEALAQSYVAGSMGMTTIAEARLMVAREAGTASIYKMISAQLGLNLAVIANPYVLAIIGVIALGTAIWAMSDSLATAQHAQNAVNSITEKAAKSADDLSSRTNTLTGAINEHNSTILSQVTAFSELQNKYPELLKNYDLQTFKSLGATEQQKLLNAEMERMAGQGIDDQIAKQKKLLENLKNGSFSDKNDTKKIISDNVDGTGFISFFQQRNRENEDYLEIQKSIIAKLEEQKSAKLELIRLAEIEKLPEAEKKAYYEAQKKLLEEKLKLLLSTADAAYLAEKHTRETNKQFSILGEQKEVPEWFTMTGIIAEKLKKDIEAINGKLNQKDTSKPKEQWDKNAWEVEKKAAENAWEKTTPQTTSKDKASIKARIDAAKDALKAWDISDSSQNKVESRADKIAKDKIKLTKEIAQEQLNLDKKTADLELQLRQDKINLMPDSYAKEFEQLKFNNEKKQVEIKRAAAEELVILQKLDDEKWALTAKRNSKGEVIGTNPNHNNVALTAASVAAYSQASKNSNATEDYGKQNLVDKLSKEYQSFDDRRREIEKKYREDESAIKSNFKEDELLSKLAELKTKNKEALQAVDKDQADSAFKNNDLLVSLFDDMAGRSVTDLRKVADQAAELFDYLKGTDVKDITPKFGLSKEQLISLKSGKADMKDIESQIKNVNEQADQLETGFKKIATAIKKVSEGSAQISLGKTKVKEGERLVKSGDPELIADGNKRIKAGMSDIAEGSEKAKKGMSGVASVFSEVSKYADQAVGLLNAISTKEGDVADQAAKSIGAVMKIAAPVVDSLAKGDYVGAAISLVTGTLTQIMESEKAHQAALTKLAKEKAAQQKEYNDLLIKQNILLGAAETIFGADGYKKALGYAQQAAQYAAILNDKGNSSTYKSPTMTGGGRGVLGWVDRQKIDYKDGSLAALKNATVQTGSHKGGLFGWGGEVADYGGLLSTYPKLIDENGKLNQSLAQSILNNQTLDESSKEALQSALTYSKDYDEALKNMGDYLESVFGSLGSDMMTAITTNLNDSQAALDAFGQSAGNTIEKLMSDIAYSMFFADKFKKMSEQALAIQADTTKTPEEKAAEQTKLLGDFYAGIGDEVKGAQTFLKDSKEAAAKSGFDLWNEANTRTASAKGFSTMSQSSADELNGRFTAIQGYIFAIVESMKILQSNSSQSLKHLAGIETNTARLEAIEGGINSVKQGISDINTKGIFIKV